MNPVRFHPEAEAEMLSAAKFYEIQQKDLGKRFLASVQDSPIESKSTPSCTMKSRMAYVVVSR
jgi:hypothetical protein